MRLNLFYKSSTDDLRVAINIDETKSGRQKVSLKATANKGVDTFKFQDILSDLPEPFFFGKLTIRSTGKGASSLYSPFEDFQKYLDKLYNNPQIVAGIAGELNKQLEELLETADQFALDDQFVRAVAYGPVGGADLYFRGRDGVSEARFRCDGESFLFPKDFMIWYASYYNVPVEITKEEWRTLLSQWLLNVRVEEASEDPLVPKVLDELLELMMKNKITSALTVEDVMFLKKGSYAIFELNNGIIRVPAKVYDNITEKNGTTPRKMRQLVEKYLVGESSKTFTRQNESIRMWEFDWNKLCNRYPQLLNLPPMELVLELDELERIYCSDCDYLYGEEDYIEHLSKPHIPPQDEGKTPEMPSDTSKGKKPDISQNKAQKKPIPTPHRDGDFTCVRILKDQEPIAWANRNYHLRQNDIVYLPKKLANVLLKREGVAARVNLPKKDVTAVTSNGPQETAVSDTQSSGLLAKEKSWLTKKLRAYDELHVQELKKYADEDGISRANMMQALYDLKASGDISETQKEVYRERTE